MIDPENMTDEESDAYTMAMFAEYGCTSRVKWDDAAGYDLSDPKHPTWAERMADAADMRRKELRENGNESTAILRAGDGAKGD